MSIRSRLGGRGTFPLLIVGVVAGLTTLVLWNAFHYDWVRSYDAWATANYVDSIEHHLRLPTSAQSDVWHNPPFFFAVAACLQELATAAGWKTDPYKAVQLLSAVSVVALCVLAFLTARELWPRSRTAQLGALVLAATTPVLVRGGALYHPEPLAALLVTAASYVLVRSFVRERLTVRSGALAGVLLGLANLTRTWALAGLAAILLTLAAAWWWRRSRQTLRFGAAVVGVTAVFLLPWLAYKTIDYGSPLAYSQPNPSQWHGTRPLSFYLGSALHDVYTHPYYDHYRNQLLPVVYTDWWGDYWRYWNVPSTMTYDPPTLPGRLDSARRLQSYVGILPSLLMLAGFLALAWQGVRRRSPALLLLISSVLLLTISYAGFLIEYPKQDGDNMKSLYLLNAAVPLAVCGGWAVERLRHTSRLFLAGLALIALELLYLDVRFLLLT